MTNEIIDKYLDTQGITSGEWTTEYDETIISEDGAGLAYDIGSENIKVMCNARSSLRDWVMVAWIFYKTGKIDSIDYEIFKLATENIEASLGKPWSQVSEALERME